MPKAPSPKRGPPTPRRFKKTTPFNAGLYHLQRFGATRGHLRYKLKERARRSRAVHGGEEEEHLQWIDEALDRLVALNYLDDRKYARDKARALSRKGKPPRAIAQALRMKRVPSEIIDEALEGLKERGDPTVMAGAAWLRKRRMGAYAVDPSEDVRKDLARMGRNGYPYGIAKSLLEIEDEDILFDLEHGRITLEEAL